MEDILGFLVLLGGAFIISLLITIIRISQKQKVIWSLFICILSLVLFTAMIIGKTMLTPEARTWTEQERQVAAEKRFEDLKKEVKEQKSKTVGMTDRTRKQIFWDLVELQDSFMKNYPYDNQKQQEAYKIIAKKYGVLENVVRQIAVRGIKEGWLKPPLR